MSEKRFKKMDTIIDPFPIWDTVEEKGYNCTDTLDLLVDLLNDQQEHITHLEDTNDNFRIKLIEDIEAMEQAEKKIGEQQATINKLKEEDKRLNDVIINLHKELKQYDKKVKMQDHIIDTQQDIINAFCELVGMINDKE